MSTPYVTGTNIQGYPIETFYTPGPTSDTAWVNVWDSYLPAVDGPDHAAMFRRAIATLPAQGGTLYVPRGTYNMASVVGNVENSIYQACFFLPGNVHLRGDGAGATVLQFAAGMPDLAYMCLNVHIGTGGDENISLEGITFDGNAANQTAPTGHTGPNFLRVRGQASRNCLFKNFRGTANSGAGETAQLGHSLSTDILLEACTLMGDAGQTATGHSINDCSNFVVIGCTARGMTLGQGFTHNTCSNFQYVGCHAYLNGHYGFNTEVSDHGSYISCLSGGVSVNAATYPYAANTSLGNTNSGFVLNGSSYITLVGCFSQKNGNQGLSISNVGPGCKIVSGDFSDNSTFGITLDTPSLPNVTFVGVTATGNATAQLALPVGYSTLTGAQGAPALPASTTALPSPYPMPMNVYIAAGTVTAIAVDGNPTGMVAGAFRLRAGATITLTYSVAPTWTWFAEG